MLGAYELMDSRLRGIVRIYEFCESARHIKKKSGKLPKAMDFAPKTESRILNEIPCGGV